MNLVLFNTFLGGLEQRYFLWLSYLLTVCLSRIRFRRRILAEYLGHLNPLIFVFAIAPQSSVAGPGLLNFKIADGRFREIGLASFLEKLVWLCGLQYLERLQIYFAL